MAVAMRYDEPHGDHTRYAVVIPFVRSSRPTAQTYVRRRLVAALIVLGLVVLVAAVLGAMTGRGGDPASAATARPDTAAHPVQAAQTAPVAIPSRVYVVRSGDTLWSIAAAMRGTNSQNDFVEALIKINGGTKLNAGQALRLPPTRG